ncbi:MAG: MBL fold metallo-hydrolase [Gammaproteobacteria bacterium]|nr:MBL fold metallo-hydrolase [Gammaproteobacteria bacterium]
MKVKEYYDSETGTFSYLVIAVSNSDCLVIDPVLKYDMISGHISDASLAPIIRDIQEQSLNLTWVLETHAHADHLSAAQQLKELFGAKVGIGKGIIGIQEHFKPVYGFDDVFDTTGAAFDILLQEGDSLPLGEHKIEVLETPGHTRDSISYRIDNFLFIGDTLFHPTIGTARCDFPGGDASLLFETIERILNHPDDTILCLCHDYPGADRDAETFISVNRMRDNIHLQQCQHNRDNFVKIREDRDSTLSLPKLIIPSIQVNAQAGMSKSDTNQPLVWPINRF